MEERRKYKRLPIGMELEINHLFKQDNIKIENINEGIKVVDISKSGLGFISRAELPLNYYFNAKIEFSEKHFFYCVVKIVRKVDCEEGYLFGCEFIGLAEFLSNKVEEYEREMYVEEEI